MSIVALNRRRADMAELADAIDLGSIVSRRAGSSPVIRMEKESEGQKTFVFFLGRIAS